jgi:hypothetical protein
MRRSTRGAGAGALGLLLGLAGCQTQMAAVEPQAICNFNALVAQRQAAPAPAEAPAQPAAGPTLMPLNSIAITDVAITNKVWVEATNARRTPTGTVEVWARFVNCTDFPLQIEGRTHFLDESRGPVEPVSAWQRVMLPPRTFAVYQESSTNVSAVRFYYVEVREGR